MNCLFKEARKTEFLWDFRRAARRGDRPKPNHRASILAGLLAGAAGAAALSSLYFGLRSGGETFSLYKGLPLIRRLSLTGMGFLEGARYPFSLMRHGRSLADAGAFADAFRTDIRATHLLTGLGGVGGAAGGVALIRRERRTK